MGIVVNLNLWYSIMLGWYENEFFSFVKKGKLLIQTHLFGPKYNFLADLWPFVLFSTYFSLNKCVLLLILIYDIQ